MAQRHRHVQTWLLMAIAWLGAAGAPGAELALPGFGAVQFRQHGQQEFRLLLDRGAPVTPEQLSGQTLVVRRPVEEVYLPQSNRLLAAHWEQVGVAQVLPTSAGRALMARVIWEDRANPIRSSDRVELCRIPADAAKPVLLSLQLRTLRGAMKAEDAAVVPGDHVCIEATVFCPTADLPRCAWTTDAGEFVYAGGRSAGKSLRGPALVRWRPPAQLGQGEGRIEKATIRLEVSAGLMSNPTTTTLTIRLVEPKGAYAKTQQISPRTPPFRDASQVAAGPLGSFYMVDATGQRLLHWTAAEPRSVPLGGSGAVALAAFGGAAWIVRDGSLARWAPGTNEVAAAGRLPGFSRIADIGFTAAGDLCVLDSTAIPRLALLARDAEGAWREAKLEPGFAGPGLARFCVDPLSNDFYIFDSQDKLIRRWRALAGHTYRLFGDPIHLGKAVGQFGALVAVVPRLHFDADGGPPIALVFQKGAITEKWTPEGTPPHWVPAIASPAAALSAARFAARHAAMLPDGDVLLAGHAGAAGQAGAVVAQVSASGALRRMLPLPALPPRFVAVAPDGGRFVLFRQAGGRQATERLARLGPEGWMAQDIGVPRGCKSIAAVRADRSSSDHVLVVGQTSSGRRQSVFRVDASKPLMPLELSRFGMPGAQRIPEHEAVDVASSAQHLVILDRDGKVLVFANGKPPRYVGQFDTKLRRPKAIAVMSAVTRRSAPGSERRSYVCVLPSDGQAAGIRLWEFKTPPGQVVATALGSFPADAPLSSPVTIATGFPDRQERLFVLDRGGAQVRAFDVPEIASALRQRQPLKAAAPALLDGLPFRGGRLDMAVGPGGVVHIVDGQTEAIHSFARRP